MNITTRIEKSKYENVKVVGGTLSPGNKWRIHRASRFQARNSCRSSIRVDGGDSCNFGTWNGGGDHPDKPRSDIAARSCDSRHDARADGCPAGDNRDHAPCFPLLPQPGVKMPVVPKSILPSPVAQLLALCSCSASVVCRFTLPV